MTSSYIVPQSQRHDAENKIKDDFEKLHLFLKKEEENRIAKLEKEEMQKIGMMQKITEISRDTFSLSDTVKDMQDLGADNSFVQVIIKTQERSNSYEGNLKTANAFLVLFAEL